MLKYLLWTGSLIMNYNEFLYNNLSFFFSSNIKYLFSWTVWAVVIVAYIFLMIRILKIVNIAKPFPCHFLQWYHFLFHMFNLLSYNIKVPNLNFVVQVCSQGWQNFATFRCPQVGHFRRAQERHYGYQAVWRKGKIKLI